MASKASNQKATTHQGIDQPLASTRSPSKDLEATLSLLRTDDDTSRFAGLALLKPVLEQELKSENSLSVEETAALIQRCWDAIPVEFLDRLLKARPNDKRTKAEADSMVGLSVAILHVFIKLLKYPQDKTFTGRTVPLLRALASSLPETTTQVLDILQHFTYSEDGSEALFNCDTQVWSQLVEIAIVNEKARDVVTYTFSNTSSGSPCRQDNPHLPSAVQRRFDDTLAVLLQYSNSVSRFLDIVGFFGTCMNVLPWIIIPSLSHLASFATAIQNTATQRIMGTSAWTRVIVLTVSLLRQCPQQFPALLFDPGPTPVDISDWRPTSYIFIKMVLVDVRSSTPSLMAMFETDEYRDASRRVMGCYDILGAFITFLVESLDKGELELEVVNSDRPTSSLILPPSLLLQLRADISEAMSLTIEYMKDNYAPPNKGPPLQDEMRRPPRPTLAGDLMSSQLFALGLWLRDDDNLALRKEAASLTTLFCNVYAPRENDYGSPVLMALEGILETPEGVEAFLCEGFWEKLVKDIGEISSMDLKEPGDFDASENLVGIFRHFSERALQIVRVLLKIVESDVTGPVKEDWMPMVGLAHDMLDSSAHEAKLDLGVAIAQLAVELLVRAPRNVRKRNKATAIDLIGRAEALLTEESIQGGIREGLEEIVQGLDDLGLN
ncbi:hypothetical protein MMC28_011050 [Mycoblastus sanguinarius]|nr:hypothetical protein [Mycoblastus sanguinarius]